MNAEEEQHATQSNSLLYATIEDLRGKHIELNDPVEFNYGHAPVPYERESGPTEGRMCKIVSIEDDQVTLQCDKCNITVPISEVINVMYVGVNIIQRVITQDIEDMLDDTEDSEITAMLKELSNQEITAMLKELSNQEEIPDN